MADDDHDSLSCAVKEFDGSAGNSGRACDYKDASSQNRVEGCATV